MNISGNYHTKTREINIVSKIFDMYRINYKSITKHPSANDGDILVVLPDNRKIIVEVKEESYKRFIKYGDLGIDFISAFFFKNPCDELIWKGSPKHQSRLDSFLNSINIQKYGKLFYSKSHLWLFFVCDENEELYYHSFFDGQAMTSKKFYNYLSDNCLFAINNKPDWQLSYGDAHHSACFFINYQNPFLNQYKVKLDEFV